MNIATVAEMAFRGKRWSKVFSWVQGSMQGGQRAAACLFWSGGHSCMIESEAV